MLAVPLEGPINADFEIQRLGNEIQVTGTVRATARLQCSRCLAPFDYAVAGTVEATFAPPAKLVEGDHQHELAQDELEVEPLIQGGADLRGVIAEQIHLNLPLKPLCREDCPGICPHCGAQYDKTGCLDCGALHPIGEWTTPPSFRSNP